MKFESYPLHFEPILKERIWGGEKLKTVLNKPITSSITGESWELSTVEGDVSIVSNGVLKGSAGSPITEGSNTANPIAIANVPKITTGKI